ncbi:hypothetical protein HDU76_000472 [Blyttiomyces sp. JEL0837]|nr:hypothetical protein HDU76_000472 [Blyttiomyces sp. JEL0837]
MGNSTSIVIPTFTGGLNINGTGSCLQPIEVNSTQPLPALLGGCSRRTNIQLNGRFDLNTSEYLNFQFQAPFTIMCIDILNGGGVVWNPCNDNSTTQFWNRAYLGNSTAFSGANLTSNDYVPIVKMSSNSTNYAGSCIGLAQWTLDTGVTNQMSLLPCNSTQAFVYNMLDYSLLPKVIAASMLPQSYVFTAPTNFTAFVQIPKLSPIPVKSTLSNGTCYGFRSVNPLGVNSSQSLNDLSDVYASYLTFSPMYIEQTNVALETNFVNRTFDRPNFNIDAGFIAESLDTSSFHLRRFSDCLTSNSSGNYLSLKNCQSNATQGFKFDCWSLANTISNPDLYCSVRTSNANLCVNTAPISPNMTWIPLTTTNPTANNTCQNTFVLKPLRSCTSEIPVINFNTTTSGIYETYCPAENGLPDTLYEVNPNSDTTSPPIQAKCLPGFNGTITGICGIYGNWTIINSTCTLISCPANGTLPISTVGATVSLPCPTIPLVNYTTTCTFGGTWVDDTSTCVAANKTLENCTRCKGIELDSYHCGAGPVFGTNFLGGVFTDNNSSHGAIVQTDYSMVIKTGLATKIRTTFAVEGVCMNGILANVNAVRIMAAAPKNSTFAIMYTDMLHDCTTINNTVIVSSAGYGSFSGPNTMTEFIMPLYPPLINSTRLHGIAIVNMTSNINFTLGCITVDKVTPAPPTIQNIPTPLPPFNSTIWTPLGCYVDSNTRIMSTRLNPGASWDSRKCLNTALMLGYKYAGLENGGEDPHVLGRKLTDSTTDTDQCLALAHAAGYKFAGLEFGGQCWASNVFSSTPSKAPESDCNMACPSGDPFCGNAWRMTVYTSDNWTPSPSSCYIDSPTRILPIKLSGSMGIEACQAAASSAGYDIIGLEAGTECWAGQRASFNFGTNIANAADCQSSCPKNGTSTTSTCGGAWRMNVFYINRWTQPSSNCYIDSTSRIFPTLIQKGLSVENCQQAASAAGFDLVGLEDSDECWGGYKSNFNFNANLGNNTDCNSPCVGNKNQICGGAWRLSVSYLTGWTQPASTCYIDSSTRLLPILIGKSMSVEGCQKAASATGFDIVGLEAGNECWGGHKASFNFTTNIATATDCNIPCDANKSQICGGAWRLSVYYL